jgi:CRP-like cAMP-binding protein
MSKSYAAGASIFRMTAATRPEVHPEELARIPLFAGLRPSELELLAKCARREVVPAGLAITTFGEHGDQFYVIEDGRARVTQDSKWLGELEAGDFFGEIALFEYEWRTATVQAATSMHLICISQRLFRELLADEPGLATQLEAAARERLARSGDEP